MATRTQQYEKFYELLIAKRVPFTQGRVHVKLIHQSSYVYQARRNGIAVKLKLNFKPGSPGWEPYFQRALHATIDVMLGRSDVVEFRLDQLSVWPEEISGPFRRLAEDQERVRSGHYLPKESERWKGLLMSPQ